MKLKIGTKRLYSMGTDTGMIGIGNLKVLSSEFDANDNGQIGGKTLILKDGREFKWPDDFFDWDKVIGHVGASPNQLLASGDAEEIDFNPPLLGALNYSGAANASLGEAQWGLIGQDDVPLGLTFSVGCDGGYAVMEARNPKGEKFGFIDITSTLARCVAVPIVRIKTDGELAIDDPCQGFAEGMSVAADLNGWTQIYAAFDPDNDRLVGIGFPLQQ